MSKKYSISYRIPKRYREEMSQDIKDNGYGLRGKSKWITEAIEDFIGKDDFVSFLESVATDELPKDLVAYPDHFSASAELRNRLAEKTLEVRRNVPQLVGTQSVIIRTAIIQRLLRKTSKKFTE